MYFLNIGLQLEVGCIVVDWCSIQCVTQN